MQNLLKRALLASALAACALPALATPVSWPGMPGTVTDAAGVTKQVTPAYDGNNAPYLGERPLTVGTPDPLGVGRAVKANCTATGIVSVTYSDNSTGSWMVIATGTQIFAAEILQINTSGTTATCSYGNMK